MRCSAVGLCLLAWRAGGDGLWQRGGDVRVTGGKGLSSFGLRGAASPPFCSVMQVSRIARRRCGRGRVSVGRAPSRCAPSRNAQAGPDVKCGRLVLERGARWRTLRTRWTPPGPPPLVLPAEAVLLFVFPDARRLGPAPCLSALRLVTLLRWGWRAGPAVTARMPPTQDMTPTGGTAWRPAYVQLRWARSPWLGPCLCRSTHPCSKAPCGLP